MREQCKKLPKYKCNKTAGLGCLGCMKYQFYAAGLKEGRTEYKSYKDVIFIIKTKKVDFSNIIKTSNVNDYNKLINCICNWNYDMARPLYLTSEEYTLVKDMIL